MGDVTLSLDALIVGVGMLIIMASALKYAGRMLRVDMRARETIENIYSNALWEYHNKRYPEKEYVQKEEDKGFRQRLDEETTKEYFKKENKK